MIVIAGSIAAEGRHGAGIVTENSHPDTDMRQGERRAETWNDMSLLKPQSPFHSDTSSPTRPCPLILPKTVPSTRDQASKYMSLWGPSHSDHHIWILTITSWV